jgi:hypothetical protein
LRSLSLLAAAPPLASVSSLQLPASHCAGHRNQSCLDKEQLIMSFLRWRVAPLFAVGLISTHVAFADEGVQLLRDRTAAARPQIMLLGTTHFANHGTDVLNNQVPDVLEPQRQKEIAAVAVALARFKPTKLAVEYPLDMQDKLDERYKAYRAGAYTLTRNETDQLGLRIAGLLGHQRVYAVDWNEMPPGQVVDFDYAQWAERNGQQARLAAMRDPGRTRQADAMMAGSAVGAWLQRFNEPAQIEQDHRRYFDYALLGDSTQYPGANWVANWYGRNLKIFANLVRLAAEPGDRVLVIYGKGHLSLLGQFAGQSGAFTVVSPLPLLQAAGAGPAQP